VASEPADITKRLADDMEQALLSFHISQALDKGAALLDSLQDRETVFNALFRAAKRFTSATEKNALALLVIRYAERHGIKNPLNYLVRESDSDLALLYLQCLPENQRLNQLVHRDLFNYTVLHKIADNPEKFIAVLNLLPEASRLYALTVVGGMSGYTPLVSISDCHQNLINVLMMLSESSQVTLMTLEYPGCKTFFNLQARYNPELIKDSLTLLSDKAKMVVITFLLQHFPYGIDENTLRQALKQINSPLCQLLCVFPVYKSKKSLTDFFHPKLSIEELLASNSISEITERILSHLEQNTPETNQLLDRYIRQFSGDIAASVADKRDYLESAWLQQGLLKDREYPSPCTIS